MSMTTTQAAADQASDASQANYLKAKRGPTAWLASTDHKRIGVLYLIATSLAFLVGGAMTLIVRLEQMEPGAMLESVAFGRYFTLQGLIVVGLFALPGISAALGNFVLPLMVGARNVAFPRLNRLAFRAFAIGAIVALVAVLRSGADSGWGFGSVSGLATSGPAGITLLAVFLLGLSAVLTGINFVVTVHTLRAPGMTWDRLPLFVWGAYAASLVQILAAPVLVAGVLMLALERQLGLGLFDASLGGDPLLFQQIFGFYVQPALAIIALSAMGVAAELITTSARKTAFGYRTIVGSLMIFGLGSLLVWGQGLTTSGQSAYAGMIFSFLSLVVLIPAGLIVMNLVVTLYGGAIRLDAPMLYGLSFILFFTVGILSGAFLSALGTGVHLNDTTFGAGHMHYLVMAGGMAFFGGLHHWWPKITGKLYSAFWSRVAAFLLLVGLNVAFFPELVAGAKGLPGRIQDVNAAFGEWVQFSAMGLFIAAGGVVLMVVYLLGSLKGSKVASANPWGARSLEWSTASPPPEQNFPQMPTVVEEAYGYPTATDHGHAVESGAVEA